ncbi:MAG: carboxypeptidase-like regulatory domain-containing protein, partial [Bacteroidota bacterium]
MLRLFVLLAALCSLGVTSEMVRAQSVEGVVTDAATGSPLPGATVVLDKTSQGTAADRDGRYKLEVRVGTVTLVFSATGYAATERSVEVSEGATVRLDVALEASVEALGEVTVEAAGSLAGGVRGVLDVPGSVTVLGPEALRRYGDTDVHRLLADVPGVTVQEEDGYGLRPNIGIRGTVADRSRGVTLMEDGVLIAPAPYASPAAYYFPATGRLDGIEVRKGSAQVAYGPYTTGGAINLVSASIPATRALRLDVRGGTDAARTLHARAGAGDLQLGPFRLGVLGEVFADGVDGFKRIEDFSGASPVGVSDETGYDLWSLHGKARLSIAPAPDVFHALELKGTYDNQLSNTTYLGLTPDDFDAAPFARYASTGRDQFDSDYALGYLRYVGLFGERFDVKATLYTTRFSRVWTRLDRVSDGQGDDLDTDQDNVNDTDELIPVNAILADPVSFADELAIARGTATGALSNGLLVVNDNARDFWTVGLDIVLGVRPGRVAGFDIDATLGLRLHRDNGDRLQTANGFSYEGAENASLVLTAPGVPGDAGNRIDRARALAAFAEVALERGPLTLTPGLRLELVGLEREDFGAADPDRQGTPATRSNTVTALIPGLGVQVEALRGVTVFGGLHRGFAPPSSAPGVEAEESIVTELGTRIQRGAAFSAQVVGFGTWYDNLLGSDTASSGGSGTGDLFNGGAARVVGAEASVDLDPLAFDRSGTLRLPLRLAYTFTDARFQSDFRSSFLPWGVVREGDRLPYVVPHVLTFGAGIATEAVRLDVRANWHAETRDRAGQGTIPEEERVDARLVIDLTGEAALPFTPGGARLSAYATVRNLTDALYVASRRP